MANPRSFLKSYRFSLLLLTSMAVGCLVGHYLPSWAGPIKPLGDFFLRALFMIIVPLIYFSIASAVASMASTFRLLRTLGWMLLVFSITGVIAACLMTVAVGWYPPAQGFAAPPTPTATTAPAAQATATTTFATTAAATTTPATMPVAATAPAQAPAEKSMGTFEQLLRAFTAGDFADLLSMKNTLALIVFAILTGLAASAGGDKTAPFTAFLQAGNEVFMKVVGYVMYLAPIGMGAYFANLVVEYGTVLVGAYGRAMLLYYPLTIAYFFVAFTLYALAAGGWRGLRFWEKIWPPTLTALATCSSYAAIPANLVASEEIGVPRDIAETVIPIGATIHMDGSCLAAVLKIAFVFGVFHMDFTSPEVLAKAVGVALLAGMVISGIPGGGITGEVLIMTMFRLPPEALPLMNAIGQFVDPPATLVNSVGDTVASMMVARIMGGRKWMNRA